jgi:signal transduction histidine kinase/CheY-like chemotaxis protein
MLGAAHILAVAVDPAVVEQFRGALGPEAPALSEAGGLAEGLARLSAAMPAAILLSPPPDAPLSDALRSFHERALGIPLVLLAAEEEAQKIMLQVRKDCHDWIALPLGSPLEASERLRRALQPRALGGDTTIRRLKTAVQARDFEISLAQRFAEQICHAQTYDDLYALLLESMSSFPRFSLAGCLLFMDTYTELAIKPFAPVPEATLKSFAAALAAEYGRISGDEVRTARRRVRWLPPPETSDRAPADPAALVGAPLHIGDFPIGYIAACLPAGNEVTQQDLDLLERLASHTSTTVLRFRLLRAAERARIESLVESLPDGLLLVDTRGRVALGNPTALRLLRALDGPGEGGVLGDLGGAPVGDAVAKVLSGKERIATLDVRGPGGLHQQVTVTPVKNVDDSITAAAVLLHDRARDQALNDRLVESERSAVLSRFAGGIAHELNSPLTGIIGFAELLLSDASVPERLRGPIGTIRREGLRVMHTTRNLLALARPSARETVPCLLPDIVRSAADLLAYDLRSRPVTFELKAPATVPLIDGDFHRLQLAVLNLLARAVEAAADSAAKPGSVVAEIRTDGGKLVLEVADSGPEIPAGRLPALFAPPAGDLSGRESSLRLSVTQSILAEHGATVAVRTGPGGTVFTVHFPRAEPKAPATTPAVLVPPPPGSKVLVIDDEPAMLELFSSILEGEGYRVERATDGQEGLELAKKNPDYALILCDVVMPRTDGRAFFAGLRKQDPALARRVVFVTGDALGTETRLFIAGTGNPSLSKPFSVGDFYRALGAAGGR